MSMFPVMCTTAPLPMYAFTVGDADAVELEPPTPASRPNDVPDVFASASGSASAATRRFPLAMTVDVPARYALTGFGLAVAVALLPVPEMRPPAAAFDLAAAVGTDVAWMTREPTPAVELGPTASPSMCAFTEPLAVAVALAEPRLTRPSVSELATALALFDAPAVRVIMLSKSIVVFVATYVSTSGLDVALAVPPATAPRSAMPPSSTCAKTLLPLGVYVAVKVAEFPERVAWFSVYAFTVPL